MLNRLNSIKYQVIEQILLFKKKSLTYIFSFYIALILPVLIVNSIYGIFEDKKSFIFRGIENSIVCRWNSDEAKQLKLNADSLYTNTCSFDSRIQLDSRNTRTVNIIGIDEKLDSIDPFLLSRGEMFTPEDFSEAKKVCIVGDKLYHKLENRNYISIEGNKYRITGRTNQRSYENAVIVPFKSIETKNGISYDYKTIVINNKNTDYEKLSDKIEKSIKSDFRNTDNINLEDGKNLKKQYEKYIKEQVYIRIAIAVISILFFIINQSIITYEQLKENKKLIALKLSMGVSSSDLVLCSFVESLILSIASNLLLLITIRKISSILNEYIEMSINLRIVFYVMLISVIICALMNIVVVKWLNRFDIKKILVSEGE